MRRYSIFIALLMVLFWPQMSYGQVGGEESDSTFSIPGGLPLDSSVTVSLLTCSPGQETYELYGHTAIRVRSSQNPQGTVYNYGAFDFRAPHFVWRFVLGECDYLLLAEPFHVFLKEYYDRGSWVMEQVLDLTPQEANSLKDSLQRESLPENRVYRYNIFRSNCTTRTRDIIEQCVLGRVEYPARLKRNTFRTILHQFTKEHPWAREGNDLLLGTEVDTMINHRDEMFAPIYLMWYADSALVYNGRGAFRNLVRERSLLLEANVERQQAEAASLPGFPLSPRLVGWLLFIVGLCVACFEWRRGRICWPVDAVVMTLQGLAGILLCFMALFSVHPGVASNWQVWVLNPLPLFFIYSVVKADIHHERNVYHTFAAAVLLAFLVLYLVVPQDFSELILPLALLLLSRAVVHLLVYRK